MKKLFYISALVLFFGTSANGQSNLFSAGNCHTSAPPAFNPGARGCRIVLDTTTQTFYTWVIGTTWDALGSVIDVTIGCVPPAYVPTKWQSDVAVNGCDSLYRYRAGYWRHLNPASVGAIYTAGTGIDITGTVISNTGDLSATNELNTGFGINGTDLRLTDAGGNLDVSLLSIAPVQSITTADFDLTAGLLALDYTNAQKATAGQPGFLTAADWATFNNKGNGTVTSVGLDLPAEFVEAGTPVTTSGTLSATWATQAANLVFRSGNAGGTPSFSALTAADIPAGVASLWTDGGADTYLTATGDNVAIGTTTATSRLQVKGAGATASTNAILVQNSASTELFRVLNDGTATIGNPNSPLSGAFGSTLVVKGGNSNGLGIINAYRDAGAGGTGLKISLNNSGGNQADYAYFNGLIESNTTGVHTGALAFFTATAGSLTEKMRITSAGNVGIGTTSPDRLLHAEASDAVTNAVTYAQRLTHITSGTATTGFGVGIEVEMENGSGTNRIASTQEVTWSDAVDATEDATWKLRLIRAGTLTDALSISSLGALVVPNSIFSSSYIVSTVAFQISGRSVLRSPSSGVFTLLNAAETDFNRLQFGTTDNTSPSWKRSGVGFIARLSDDSENTTVTASNLISTATVRLQGYTVATLPTPVVGDMCYVTDATAPTYGATVVGGGAVVTVVFYDGTNWTCR